MRIIIKATFMSRPTTTVADRRTWLIKIGDEPSAMVRVYPDGEDDRRFICDCKGTTNPKAKPCLHVTAAIDVDQKRFF